MEPVIIYDHKLHSHLLPDIASLHAHCILSPPYMIANFLPPLDHQTMLAWWTERAQEAAGGHRAIVLQLAPSPTLGDAIVAGVVMLGMPISETGPFRGIVEKLIVSPDHRKKGIAKAMMLKLEEVAKKEGRTLLLLDTERGSPAELIYPKLGFVQVGIVPAYEISHIDGSRKDGVFFYKDLRDTTVS